MEDSILKSTKKVCGIPDDVTIFDLDVLMSINSAFGVLHQLGIGPVEGFVVEDGTSTWSSLNLPLNIGSMVRTYIYLKTRLVFDPPPTSFALDAVNKQIQEHEFRLTVARDEALAALEEVV